MSEIMEILSHKGSYNVTFDDAALERLNREVSAEAVYVVDQNVARLHAGVLDKILGSPSVLVIEATEPNKSLDAFGDYIERLMALGVRRGHTLVAIGGGIIQDIVCFLAATLYRGMAWTFYPTTLLAQADSCIGSKSSINVGKYKNILGTFTPPGQIFVTTRVLSTLDIREIKSGVGEMLKVHAIDGPESYDRIAADYDRLFTDPSVLLASIHRSLEIKKRLIELDEFDQGPRNIMNYGHSFGHAIESATDFAIPHGIAVSIGSDMANWISARLGHGSPEHYTRMHTALAKNYAGFEGTPVPLGSFLAAIARDKKNTASQLRLILPGPDGRLSIGLYPKDQMFVDACTMFLQDVLPQGR